MPHANASIGTILHFRYQLLLIRQILVDVLSYTKYSLDLNSDITDDPIFVLKGTIRYFTIGDLGSNEAWKRAQSATVKNLAEELFADRTYLSWEKCCALADTSSDAAVTKAGALQNVLATDLADKKTCFMEAWSNLCILGAKIIAFEAKLQADANQGVVTLPREGSIASTGVDSDTEASSLSIPFDDARSPSFSDQLSELFKEDNEKSGYSKSLHREILSLIMDKLRHSELPSSSIRESIRKFKTD